MARVGLTVYPLTVAGTAVTMTAPNGSGSGNGNTFTNDGRTVIVINATAVRTVTVPVNTNSIDGERPADHTQVLTTSPAINYVWVPPTWNATAGVTAIDIDSAAGITWAAVQMPAAFS